MRFGKNKYGARATGGFPSRLEAAVYGKLLLREKLGEIRDIKRQQQVVLQGGSNETRITWRLDFSAVDCKTDKVFYVEAKGFETNDFRIKLKLWKMLKPATLEIWKGGYMRPFMAERIEANEEKN